MAKDRLTVALVGNPNSGKSSLFNLLTGLRQHVSNFPGVTVDKKIGVIILENGEKVDLIDFPGTYSLFPNSNDEKLVINILTNPKSDIFPDLIIYVADATQLDRHLLLATQIIDLGIPTIFALNMIDILESNKESVDLSYLEKKLQVPVIAVSGRTGKNLEVIKNRIEAFSESQVLKPSPDQTFYQLTTTEKSTADAVGQELNVTNPYGAKILAHHFNWLNHLTAAERIQIKSISNSNGFEDLKFQIAETMQRYQDFGPIVKKTLSRQSKPAITTSERIDGILTHRIIGPIIFFVVMLFMFQAIYAWAEAPMDWIEGFFNTAGITVRNVLPAGWITDLIVDGLIAGLGGIMVFIPQITILFLLITILEEAGYMSRAVFMFDGLMQRFGLNGRSVVALVSSGACAIPAIMSTRTIGNWKERLITIMVTPLISCSARIPVYTVLIGFVVPAGDVGIFNTQGLAFMGLYLLGIVSALVSACVFKLVLDSQERSFLMIELPQYKPPIWKNVLLTVKEKVSTFIIQAGKIILMISVILWFLASYGPSTEMQAAEEEAISLASQRNLSEEDMQDLIASNKIEASYAGHIGKFIEPAIRPLGFDWKIGIALITSFAAREVFVGTMATIYSVGSSDDEATVRQRMAAEISPATGRPVYSFATSLSLLIFYVFAMQCMSTLAITKRETNSWKWPIIQFTYMGALAYLGSLMVFQLFS